MKTLILTFSLFASQAAFAISNCYVYSDTPQLQAQCEREAIYQQQEWKNQQDTLNQGLQQTEQSQAAAQQADQAIQQQQELNQLLKVLTPPKQ